MAVAAVLAAATQAGAAELWSAGGLSKHLLWVDHVMAWTVTSVLGVLHPGLV